MTGDPGKFFLDTNILVYAHDHAHQEKQSISERLILSGIEANTAVLSTQVINEWFVTITQKIKTPLPVKAAREEIVLLKALEVVELSYDMILQAIDLQVSKKMSFWDALIIVAALTAECRKLYSEDMQDGQKIGELKIVNPYLHPDEISS
jgi:predicted nucleic acid-binding protein